MISFGMYNSKGGVGKTAAAVNLSYLASRDGLKTLIWDIDPQASATFYYRIKPKIKGGAQTLVRRDRTLNHYTKHTQYDNLDMLPSDFSTRKLDLILGAMKKSKKQLKKSIKSIADEYDVVIIDSPPTFSLVSENIILAADYILFPIIPTTLSMRTYEQVLRYFEKKDIEFSKIIPFFSMVDRRKKAHKETVDQFTFHPTSFLKTIIPYSSDVEKMGEHCAPLHTYSSSSAASKAFLQLWLEIKRRAFPRDYPPPS